MSLTNLGSKMKKLYSFYQNAIQTQKDSLNFRFLKPLEIEGKYIFQDGRKLLNLSSNDYLGISTKKEIFRDFLSSYDKPLNVPSARLLCANTKSYTKLEELLCEKFSKEAALLFNSGYHANVGIYSSLAKNGDVVFCDKLNHASIVDGIRLSKSELIPFKHSDYDDLENKLKKYRAKYNNAIISTEALFSMDGDFCDIKKLIELKEKYNAILVVDEAHSFGVYGSGLGFCAQEGVLDKIDLLMATFGKSVGSYGAFCVGDRVLIDYLINFARSFIFSTVFPQINAEFSYYVLKNYIFKSDEFSKKLLELTDFAHKNLKGFNVLGSSYIVPVVFGENKKAIEASKKLYDAGYYCLPIRYPTVAKNSARLRISLNSAIEESDIFQLIDYMKKL